MQNGLGDKFFCRKKKTFLVFRYCLSAQPSSPLYKTLKGDLVDPDPDCQNCKQGEDVMAEYQEWLNADQTPKKICKNPDCEKAGVFQPLDNFYITNGGQGTDGLCKKCRMRKQKETRKRKKQRMPKIKIESQEPQSNEKPKKDAEADKTRGVFLDFRNHPEAFDAIDKIAAEELRTVENQILYWLVHKIEIR